MAKTRRSCPSHPIDRRHGAELRRACGAALNKTAHHHAIRRDRIVGLLATASLREECDQDFIDERILPRVVVCDPVALVHQVFAIESDHLVRQVQDAQQHSKAAKIIRASYNTICGRQSHLRTLDWMSQAARLLLYAHFLILSAQATNNQAHKLTIAEVQRWPRLTDRVVESECWSSGRRLTPTKESRYFLSCHRQKMSTSAPSLGSRMLATSLLPAHPLVDVMLDLAQHALTQPTRLFAPGLAVVDGDAYLVVLDHEVCRIAEIAECWGAGFGVFAAVLSTLLGLDVYSSGFSPLFRYECCRGTGLTPVCFYPRFLCRGKGKNEDEGSSVIKGRTAEFEKEEPIELLVSHVLDRGRSSIFGGHLSSETIGHLALPELTKSLPLHYSQAPDHEIPEAAKPEDPNERVKEPLRRTLDLLLLRNPTAELPRPVSEPVSGLRQVYRVFDQLLAGLSDTHASGIHHRDLSLSNILHHEGHLVLIDWDAGAVGASVPVAAVEGGRLSMSLATAPLGAIAWYCWGFRTARVHGLHHALESSIYWFVTVLRYHIASEDSAKVWDEMGLPPS
ncbi:BZ3500_MvSof-1268-A1-R1_Chr7-1g09151 [Microbotryum saponariae]|uniref:BZ3500_MvSof-1268-A1-R1_Chr7-1g09151 protein n=1 Tax=Microbotryum saponariae TaxID=289078 RepID=A0A2X0M1P4_9BASI|nr:BZ3501_MvSof-1269-A2-R1_Chr7-1g08856 [Microbotryum saponariae]SDA02895.1 BZ3500_MvSof-1268-A1-R1_Chr7-1g09151 [Microbotryum saponariae]